LTVKVRCISCLLSSTDIPQLIAEAMPAYHRVRKHIMHAATTTRHSNIDTSQPLTPPILKPAPVPCNQEGVQSAVQISVYLSVSHLDVALTTDEHLLARLYLDTIEVDLASIPVFAINRSQSSQGSLERGGGLSVRASVQALKLFDLTHAGSLHPMVIWKKDATNPKQSSNSSSRSVGASLPPMPMITVALMMQRGEHSRPTLTVSIQGLRTCVLYRFIEEIATFITHRFIKAIHEAITCSFPESPFSSFNSSDVPIPDDEEDRVATPFTAESLRNTNDSYSSNGIDRGTDKGVKAKEGVHEGDVPSDGKDSVSAESAPPIEWCIELCDCTIIVPRNSGSNDAIAVAITKGTVQSFVVPVSWSAPEAMQSKSGQTLFFDPIANIWRFNMDEVPTTSSSYTPPNRADDSDEATISGRSSRGEGDSFIRRGLLKSDSLTFSDASSSMQSMNSSLFESIEEGPENGERPGLYILYIYVYLYTHIHMYIHR
jgi:hypothetical protein